MRGTIQRPVRHTVILGLWLFGCSSRVDDAAHGLGDDIDSSIYGFGRPATADEIAAWDVDVMSDGIGLPAGSGTVAAGETVYGARCVSCHGPTGVEGPQDILVGRVEDDGFPFGDGSRAPLTIGSYWPYAPTLFDYIRRAMPFDAPGALSDDEVYSVVALLLHWNQLLDRDVELNAERLTHIEMPARDRFVMDDRVGGSVIR